MGVSFPVKEAYGRARAQERFSLDASVMHMEQLYGEVLGVQKGRG